MINVTSSRSQSAPDLNHSLITREDSKQTAVLHFTIYDYVWNKPSSRIPAQGDNFSINSTSEYQGSQMLYTPCFLDLNWQLIEGKLLLFFNYIKKNQVVCASSFSICDEYIQALPFEQQNGDSLWNPYATDCVQYTA